MLVFRKTLRNTIAQAMIALRFWVCFLFFIHKLKLWIFTEHLTNQNVKKIHLRSTVYKLSSYHPVFVCYCHPIKPNLRDRFKLISDLLPAIHNSPSISVAFSRSGFRTSFTSFKIRACDKGLMISKCQFSFHFDKQPKP